MCFRSSYRGVFEPADAYYQQLPPARQRQRNEDEHLHDAGQTAAGWEQHAGFTGVSGKQTGKNIDYCSQKNKK